MPIGCGIKRRETYENGLVVAETISLLWTMAAAVVATSNRPSNEIVNYCTVPYGSEKNVNGIKYTFSLFCHLERKNPNLFCLFENNPTLFVLW